MASPLSTGPIFQRSLVPGTGGKCWRAERLLGTGTCCTVWRAELHDRPDIQAALKIYKSGNAYTAACEREIMLLDIVKNVQGKSNFLVEVLDSFQYKGHACVVETLLEASLRHIITKNLQQPLSIALIKVLLKQLLSGLSILHHCGFVHGDLKPSNLLWNPQEGKLTIIDFGLSFHIKDKKIGQVQTPNYRAPECHIWNSYKRERHAPQSNPPGETTTGSLTNQTSIQPLPQQAFPSSPGSAFITPTAEYVPILTQTPLPSHVFGNGNLIHPTEAIPLSGVPVVGYQERLNTMVEKPLYSLVSKSTPSHVERPGLPADVWSVGVVIMDMAIGGRFVPSKHQVPTPEIRDRVRDILLQRRDECQDTLERKEWMLLLDLCQRIFFDEPEYRLTTEQMSQHEFFDISLNLSHRDLWLLPTPVLRLGNVFQDKPYAPVEEQEILDDVLEECLRHGPIESITLAKDTQRKIFVEYRSWRSAVASWEAAFKITFDGRKLQATFFLNDDFYKGNHY